MGNSMSISFRRCAKRALVPLCASFLLLAFAASAGSDVTDVRALWVALQGGVVKISPVDGMVSLRLPGTPSPQGFAVDQTDEAIWIYGRRTLESFDSQGDSLVDARLPWDFDDDSPAGMAVDNGAGNVWIAVHRKLYRLDMAGNVAGVIHLSSEAEALSLDASQSQLWVAERREVELFDATGKNVGGFDLNRHLHPAALAYDAYLKQTWVLSDEDLERVGATGQVTLQARLPEGLDRFLAPDGRGGLWVAGERSLAYVDQTGTAQFTLEPFDIPGDPLRDHGGWDGGDDSHGIVDLVADPLDHSAWVAGRATLAEVSTGGSVKQTVAIPFPKDCEERGDGRGDRRCDPGSDRWLDHGGEDRGIRRLALYVDTTPPTVSITAPLAGAYTNHNKPTLALSYSDIGSGVDVTSVAVTSNGANLPVTCQANADDSGASCTPNAALPDGGYSLSITVKDKAGNVSQPATVSFTVDTVPPTITVASPNKAYTNQPALSVTGSLSEAGTLSINGADVALSTTYGFSEAVTLTEGPNTFTFTATDLAGNTSTVTKSITLDTIPPSVPKTSLITAGATGNGLYTLTGTAGAIDPDTLVTVMDASTGQSVTVTSDATGVFSATLAAQAGDQLTITATDEAGNTSSAQLQLAAACGANAGPGNTLIQFASAAVTVTGPIGATLGFPVTRTGDLSFDAAVNYQTVDGSAVGGRDYAPSSGTLAVPAGASSAVLPISILGSSTNSPSKAFTLKVQEPQSHNTKFGLSTPQIYATGNGLYDGVAADLNGDGKPDIITVNNSDNTTSVLVNTTSDGGGAATFASQQTFAVGNGPVSVAVKDLNGDGKPDLVVANWNDNTITVLINTTPAGASAISLAAPQTFATGAGPESANIADINGDGKPDVIVVDDPPDNSAVVYLNTTASGSETVSFAPPMSFSVGSAPVYVAAADMNADGKPDLITANVNDNTISVLMNTTAEGAVAASFAPQQQFAADSLPSNVIVADLNGDGMPDLAVGDGGGDGVDVLVNTTAPGATTIQLGPLQTFPVGQSPGSLAAADFDGDGKLDLVSGNATDNTLSVLLNTTALGSQILSFAPRQVIPTGNFPWPVLATDLNGDGRPDIVSVNDIDNSISAFTNVQEIVCVSPASVTGTIQYDVVPPVITLSSPAGEFVTASAQAIAGKVSKPGTLSINGTNVALNPDGTFSYPLSLQPGANGFTLVATDLSGNVTTLTQTLVLQILVPVGTDMQFQPGTAPGTLTLTGQPGAATQDETVTVTDVTTGVFATGTVNADGSYSVTIAGGSTDNFSVVLTGSDGTNGTPVYLHGNDAALNLSVTYPTNGAAINGDLVTVTGTYAGTADTGVTINGEPATVSNGQFVANNVSLTTGANTLTIVATEEGGLTTTQTLNVTRNGTSPLVLSAVSAAGVAPLTVNFTYQYQGTTPLQTLEMSYLGNGTNDVVTSDPTTALSYTYAAPGIYPATLTLIDANGVQYQAVLDVVVQDPAQMDAMFKTIWGDMTAGLASGNKGAAMSVLDYTAQQNYGPVFDALLPNMNGIVTTFSSLLRSNISSDAAEYAIHRVSNGQDALYFVYFIKDINGVWHLDEM